MKPQTLFAILRMTLLGIAAIIHSSVVYAQATPLTLDDLHRHWWQADKLVPNSMAPTQAPVTAAHTAHTQSALDWWWGTFQAFKDDNWEIYFSQPFSDLYAAKRLTFNAAPDTQPRLNAIATQIVFVSARDGNSEIYTMDTNGNQQTRLTANPAIDTMPAWSPDGSQIVFVSTRTDNAELYRMNTAGQALVQLTNDPYDDLYPNLSPNGRQIAWVRSNQDTGAGTLWVMDINGDHPHPITGELRFLARPIWSPDSARIAFDYDADGDSFSQIGLINSNGSGLAPLVCIAQIAYEMQWVTAWLPDGSGLLYSNLYFRPVGNQLVLEYVQLWDASFKAKGCQDAFYLGTEGNYQLFGQDVQNSDQWPPVSTLERLPTYARATQPLLLNVVGQDIGPAGIHRYERQFRPSYNSGWQTYDYLPTDGSLTGKIYFRSRAIDNADHVEAWPVSNEGDTATTFFTWQVNGHLTDQRGVPLVKRNLPIQPAALAPMVSDAQGQFLARLRNSGKHNLNTTTLLMTSDRSRNFYVQPPANLLQNGGFEADNPLTGWVTKGSLTPQVNSADLYAGHQLIRLGQDCVEICTPPAQLPSPLPCAPDVTPGCSNGVNLGSFRGNILIVDKNDHVHTFGFNTPQSIFYQHRSPNGVWDAPIVLPGVLIGTLVGAVNQQGDLHIVWSDDDRTSVNSNLYYKKRTADGVWTTTSQVGKGAYPKLAVDGQNELHILFLDNSADRNSDYTLYYQTMPDANLWSKPVALTHAHYAYQAPNPYRYTLTATPKGVTHLFWAKPSDPKAVDPNVIIHKIHYPDNHWSGERTFVKTTSIFELNAVADSKENLHLIWSQNLGLFYAMMTPTETWSEPYELDIVGINRQTPLLIDSEDTLYVIGAQSSAVRPDSPSTIPYRYKPLGQNWSDPQVVHKDGYYPLMMNVAVGRPNSFHFIWMMQNNVADAYAYVSTISARVPGTSTISQVVTLPTTLYHPTLAFMYQLQGGSTKQSSFAVTITAGITATTVFSTNQQNTWRLGWADLEAWKGQTITITFGIQQAPDDLFVHADLDEISLSSWQTPVVQTLSPVLVDAGVEATLFITGENFIATPTVKLGETVLTNVRWLNEHQLEVEMPNTFLPGIYDLEVTNPSGEGFVHQQAVAIGRQTYLPLISR